MPNEELCLGEAGTKLIHRFEKLRKHLYDHDGGGHCTIGWGHLVHRGACDGRENERIFAHGISTETANSLFKKDVSAAEKAVHDAASRHQLSLSQSEFDALVSFAYNTGTGNLNQMLNNCRLQNDKIQKKDISQRMIRYNRSNGKLVRGLENRRKAEADLFNAKPQQPLDEGVIIPPS